MEGWKIGRLEGSSNEGVLSFPKVIIPDRAERHRGKARHVQLYSNDDPTRPCRPKAGKGLVTMMMMMMTAYTQSSYGVYDYS